MIFCYALKRSIAYFFPGMQLSVRTMSFIVCFFLSHGSNAQDAQQLFSAIQQQNIEAMKSCMEKGADPNAADEDGDNALMYAALYAPSSCMQLLLDKGADPNLPNKLGETALMWCAENNEKVKLLLSRGALINARANSGNTTFLIAAIGNHPCEQLKFLREKGADPLATNKKGENALIRSANFIDTTTVNFLMSCGLDINAVSKAGDNALLYAILGLNRDVVLQLLAKGVDPGLPNDPAGNLSVAVSMSDNMISLALLEKVKNLNATINHGMSALMYAAFNEHDNPEIIDALLKKGANYKYTDKKGGTALSEALKKGNTQSVALLRKAGAKK